MRKLALVALLLSLTACGEATPEVAVNEKGEEVTFEQANESDQAPTVKLAPARLNTENQVGFSSDDVREIHVQLESGKTVVCLFNVLKRTIDTCDWDNPLKEARPE